MAGVRWKARTSAIATGTSVKTLLQIIAPTNQALLVEEWSISFAGISNTDAPILVEVLKQTSAGTMTTSASTIVKDPSDAAETLQTTIADTATSEPTAGNILFSEYVHPQTGYTWPANGKPIKVGGGQRLGIRVTAGVSVSALVRVNGEE